LVYVVNATINSERTYEFRVVLNREGRRGLHGGATELELSFLRSWCCTPRSLWFNRIELYFNRKGRRGVSVVNGCYFTGLEYSYH